MLFGKPKLPEAERRQKVEEIEKLIDAGKNQEALALTRELEKLDANAAGLAMSYFYIMGEGVAEDAKAAVRSAQKYLKVDGRNARAWKRMGTAYMMEQDFAEAVDPLRQAFVLGDMESGVLMSSACMVLANEFRNQASSTLNPAVYSKANGQALTLYAAVCAAGSIVGEQNPGLMDDADWQCYGRACDMMYGLSLNGEAHGFQNPDDMYTTYASAAKGFAKGRKDTQQHEYWRMNGVLCCSLMEKAGYKAMAEYFRAGMCLNVVDRKKDAKKLASAKWHFDKADELTPALTDEQRRDYAKDFADFREQYDKFYRRFGKTVESDLKAGRLPDLSGEYPEGAAPAPDSCQTFMNSVSAVRAGGSAAGSGAPAPKKKGFFGLF